MKQFSLIKDVIKEKEDSKGVTYYIIDKEIVETVYDRYFFTVSSSPVEMDSEITEISDEDEEPFS